MKGRGTQYSNSFLLLQHNVKVLGIEEQTVVNVSELAGVLVRGQGMNSTKCLHFKGEHHVIFAVAENRTVGTTLMNDKSSRSHSIFTITIESRLKSPEETDGVVKVAALVRWAL